MEKKEKDRLAFFIAFVSGIVTIIGVLTFAAGYGAQKTAEAMKSSEWINNDRCRQQIEALAPADNYRFSVLGDIQIGTGNIPRLMRVVENHHSLFLVQTGDIAGHADPGHYRVLLNELGRAGLRMPLFVTPGNHDVRDDRENLFEQYFGPKQLVFKYQNDVFIILDNVEPNIESQYAWLEHTLEQNQGHRYLFLFMHAEPMAPIDQDSSAAVPGFERLFELVEQYKVNYVFTGNWHGYHREVRNGTVFIINGRGGDFDHDARMVPCYITLVDVGPEGVRDKVVEMPPELSIVLNSLLSDWVIAHIGEAQVEHPAPALLFLILSMLVCVSCFGYALKRKHKNSSAVVNTMN